MMSKPAFIFSLSKEWEEWGQLARHAYYFTNFKS